MTDGRPSERQTERRGELARLLRRERVHDVASRQSGIVSVHQALRSGLTRQEVEADVRARRWQRAGHQCLVVHTGPLVREAVEWLAVLDSGPRACLDGASSLVRAGLKNFEVERVRVSVPRGVPVTRNELWDVRQTRRLRMDDLAEDSIPRTRSEVAAVRAALWARTDREAGLVVSMAVQQRVTTPQLMAAEMVRVRRDRRRLLLNELIIEVGGGAESLGEIDVARECRERGLPEPSRQVKRQGRGSRWFVDVEWKRFGVIVEVDGIHHSWADQVVGDALRQNELAISGAVVLRLPLSGLRWAPDEFFGQIEAALVARGWRRG